MLLKDLKKLQLDDINLGDKELKTYLAILELGEATVTNIAKQSGILRTTTYDIVNDLLRKGFISTYTKGKKKLYTAESPKRIADMIEEKGEIFNKMLPNLLTLANSFNKRPSIKIYEGRDGVREIYKDMLIYENQEIVAWWANAYTEGSADQEWFFNYYGPKRVERKISIRAIMPDTSDAKPFQEKAQERLSIIKAIPQENDIPVPILLYGNKKIAIVSDSDNIGVIIENQKMYTSLKTIFEMSWKNLG